MSTHDARLDAYADMVKVAFDAFYAAMKPLNVHPCPRGFWVEPHGYVTEWKAAGGAGAVVGVSSRGDYRLRKGVA